MEEHHERVTRRVPERVRWAVGLLDVGPSDHLLEIGCGPGHAIALICPQLSDGSITAIDRSPTMIERARARNAACLAAGRAHIEQQDLMEAALERRFTKVFAVNVNAFWTAPAPSIGALEQLLERDGKAFLVYEPPTVPRLRELERSLPPQLELRGFSVADVRAQRFRSSHGLCIVAVPRAEGPVPR